MKAISAATTASDRAPGTGASYSYRPSLVGAARTFTLTDEGLAYRAGMSSGTWPYASIAAIRLSWRPVSQQARRFRADLHNDRGRRLQLVSASWQTAALVAPQDQPYRQFILELHRRIAAAGGRPVLMTGLRRSFYGLAAGASALVGVMLAALFVRAAFIGSFAGMAFMVGFAALFAWQIGGFLRRNRPHSYTLDAVPRDLLP
ncbi:hypothetical protein JQ557_17120 [Bradyrhizobium sp. U87765 SZCCT0131]|uniref:hypothetical protein n=1 Tax=unclassified Bradyrhizobium TaxID=2631580 RepID=UPI001BA87CFA|nr:MULTISPECIES: hypothetical protein [unclassified Bradyrhizobium]MBR1219732.1 hypothetical protein [Bradyrhizobium sp. U87765 SZCCT0131]MBR1262383.1 hypothetical protein [Bradyrhizobium sp. U87765 SZCCT0134]MBR1308434.1 hypothetical protein [Bradyrhizobium sp. U87765 SZCCT0110]MBR1318165.1 hypothetical protein [Bradyrhizobium sp. U87765 SZCCT0109]MBR1351868.1 hypothetical protein [Bradyrhizobium sp. U87765 SZCCT0048]